jgi:hypothetical protein
VLFYEYFHGDSGRGVGASHQTGWTALVVRLMAALARARGEVAAGAPPSTVPPAATTASPANR